MSTYNYILNQKVIDIWPLWNCKEW
jgi:hypothetical protein